jgi:hypothetical protein
MIAHVGKAMDANPPFVRLAIEQPLNPIAMAEQRPLAFSPTRPQHDVQRSLGVKRAHRLTLAEPCVPTVRRRVREIDFWKEGKLMHVEKVAENA